MIDITKEYQTRDGREVRLYADDGVGPYPIHGAIRNEEQGGWELTTWNPDGRFIRSVPFDVCDLVPVPDWRDEIPWNCIKPEYRWVARDKNGEWAAYGRHPETRGDTGRWFMYGETYAELSSAIAMPAGPDDWREAIAERPEGA